MIIHIHGGGYVGNSSGSHQSYVRDWCNAIPNAAFFSIDYRLAPESKYPDQLEDCWQAYTWLVLNVKSLFGIDFKRIILTGDSAGGNIGVGLTLMCIRRSFKLPDSIFLIYPVCSCSTENFYPTNLNSVDDKLLSTNILLMMARCIVPEGGEENRLIGSRSMYLTPATCASDEDLARFPPIRLMLAGTDVFRDEGIFLLDRLL